VTGWIGPVAAGVTVGLLVFVIFRVVRSTVEFHLRSRAQPNRAPEEADDGE
jgi:hypothetical protein